MTKCTSLEDLKNVVILRSCRAGVSKAEEDMLFEKYIKTLTLRINSDGEFVLEIAGK